MKGFTFNGQHSYKDLRLTMPTDPQISFPSKVKNQIKIPGTNILYDRDIGKNTQEYEEREIRVTLNVLNFKYISIESTQDIMSDIANWLQSTIGRQRLEIDIIPSYYFMAEVIDIGDFETNFFKYGIIEIVFNAYPYRIRKLAEGNDLWDEFDFDNDVWQDVKFRLPTIYEQAPLKELAIGDMVTIGGWTEYQGQAGVIEFKNYQTERFYEITDVGIDEEALATTPSLISPIMYKVDDWRWFWHKDLVQSRQYYADVELINTGSTAVFPDIKRFNYSGQLAGLTIEVDGRFYNFRKTNDFRDINDKLALNKGVNNWRIYGQGQDVEIIWHKEVL